MVRKLVGSCMEGGRDKQCSTTSDISQVSSSEDQKLNTSHNRASKERASNQIRGAKKAPHSPDGDISCISGLHMSNTVGEASVCSELKGGSSSALMPPSEAAYVSEHSEMKDCKEKLLSVHPTYCVELPLPSGSADITTGSDHADEVRVCDICGDVGREHLLAICTKCIDGVEHINAGGLPQTKKRFLVTGISPKRSYPQKKLFRNVSSSSQKNMAEGKVRSFPMSDSPRTNFSNGKSCLLKSKSFNSGEVQLKDHQQQQCHERRHIVSIDKGKGDHNKILYKSQSFKDGLSKYSNSNISKPKKIMPSASPRLNDQIRVRQIVDDSSFLQKSISKFGLSSDDKRKLIQGCENLSDSLKSQKHEHQKLEGDQPDENSRIMNNLKVELSCKINELDANSSSRGLVIPHIDISWKGDFEVWKGEGLTDLYLFIQAHKSSHACAKVDAAVKELPNKIVLSEAPCLSTWPTQFKNSQAIEENIAIFFFAENLKSHGAYKSLLERITANDLALKWCHKGVELLIFSSQVLPKESQRWNNFLYLWGAFRITSDSPNENESSSQNKLSHGFYTDTPKQMPTTDGLPLASHCRVYKNSEPGPSSSGLKFLPVKVTDLNFSLIDSLVDRKRDVVRSMELDMEFARDNNTRYPAFGATNKELHTDRKLKATVNRLPEACTQNLIRFFDAGPFHCRDLASSSSSAGINDARIPTDYEQSTLEDINLDLSLRPVNKTVKREALNLNFEPSYEKIEE